MIQGASPRSLPLSQNATARTELQTTATYSYCTRGLKARRKCKLRLLMPDMLERFQHFSLVRSSGIDHILHIYSMLRHLTLNIEPLAPDLPEWPTSPVGGLYSGLHGMCFCGHDAGFQDVSG